MFTPTWGNDPIGLVIFRWVETTNQLCFYELSRSIVFDNVGKIASKTEVPGFYGEGLTTGVVSSCFTTAIGHQGCPMKPMPLGTSLSI